MDYDNQKERKMRKWLIITKLDMVRYKKDMKQMVDELMNIGEFEKVIYTSSSNNYNIGYL